jgi:hypothetical protein
LAVVYQHRRLDKNAVFYIGIGTTKARAYRKTDRNSHWRSIVSKTEYEVDILIDGCSWEDACQVERGLIEAYGRYDLGKGPLVNQTDGGEGNSKLSPEKRILKGQKIRERKQGVPNIKLRGRGLTEDHKNNVRLANIGKKYSEEVNKKKGRSEEQLGEKNPMFGRMYITDGIRNSTIKKSEVIPNGWKKGRTPTWKK